LRTRLTREPRKQGVLDLLAFIEEEDFDPNYSLVQKEEWHVPCAKIPT